MITCNINRLSLVLLLGNKFSVDVNTQHRARPYGSHMVPLVQSTRRTDSCRLIIAFADLEHVIADLHIAETHTNFTLKAHNRRYVRIALLKCINHNTAFKRHLLHRVEIQTLKWRFLWKSRNKALVSRSDINRFALDRCPEYEKKLTRRFQNRHASVRRGDSDRQTIECSRFKFLVHDNFDTFRNIFSGSNHHLSFRKRKVFECNGSPSVFVIIIRNQFGTRLKRYMRITIDNLCRWNRKFSLLSFLRNRNGLYLFALRFGNVNRRRVFNSVLTSANQRYTCE